MTAILAIDFIYQIIAMADCRVSWDPPAFNPQDNLLKMYPVGPTGILGFSGSIQAAKAAIGNFVHQVAGKPLPPSAGDIVSDISQAAREAYSQLPRADKGSLQLMYVAPDYAHVTLSAPNVDFARNVMVKMEEPQFAPVPQADAVRLGYASRYPLDNIRLNRNNLVGRGLTPEGRKFQVGIAIGAFAPALARYAPHQVGGLFTIAVASSRGVGWWPYGPIDGYELVIEDENFIQVDHNDERRVPLKRLLEFDPTRPDAGNIVFETPKV